MLDEHLRYLRDERRLDLYRRALRQVIRPGDRVLDLGAGTGVLGLLAVEAGAGRVFAVDDGPILDHARRVAERNGLADRIVHIRGSSRRIRLPEPVDVVVADQIAPAGVGAGLQASFVDAARRHLAPGGRLVPGRIEIRAFPVSLPAGHDGIAFWNSPVAGFDFSDLRRAAASEPIFVAGEAGRPLGPAVPLADYVPAEAGEESIGGRGRLEIETPGSLEAIGVCFRAELVPGVVMTNEPRHPEAIARTWMACPLLDPVAVEPGDGIDVALHQLPVGGTLRWSARVSAADGAVRSEQSLCTLDTVRFDAEALRRRAADRVPGLGPDGAAAARVLERLAEGASVASLQRLLADEFGDRWPADADREMFVADLVDRFGGDGGP